MIPASVDTLKLPTNRRMPSDRAILRTLLFQSVSHALPRGIVAVQILAACWVTAGCGRKEPPPLSAEQLAERDRSQLEAFQRQVASGETRFDLSRQIVTDEWLKELQGRPIESLRLINLPITDAGLEYLRGMTSLQELALDGTEVTDKGMEVVATLTGLERLQLDHDISGAALSHLSGLKNLKELSLTEKVRDEDLKYLEGLTELRTIGPLGEFVTDEGLKSLRGMKKLTVITLPRSKVTDEGLKLLRDFPELASLRLDYTQVTDAGLETLAQFPKLNLVFLGGTRVTPAGIEKLKAAKPSISIVR